LRETVTVATAPSLRETVTVATAPSLRETVTVATTKGLGHSGPGVPTCLLVRDDHGPGEAALTKFRLTSHASSPMRGATGRPAQAMTACGGPRPTCDVIVTAHKSRLIFVKWQPLFLLRGPSQRVFGQSRLIFVKWQPLFLLRGAPLLAVARLHRLECGLQRDKVDARLALARAGRLAALGRAGGLLVAEADVQPQKAELRHRAQPLLQRLVRAALNGRRRRGTKSAPRREDAGGRRARGRPQRTARGAKATPNVGADGEPRGAVANYLAGSARKRLRTAE